MGTLKERMHKKKKKVLESVNTKKVKGKARLYDTMMDHVRG